MKQEWTSWHEGHADKIELIAGVDCWIWTGCTHPKGHGRVNSRSGHNYAHRASLAAYDGAIPKGKLVRHMCGCAACVRPGHLKVGTAADNARDMAEMLQTKSKLSFEDVRKIRASYDAGTSLKDIAEDFDIAFGSVYPIVCHQNFKHVDRHLKGKHKARVSSYLSDEDISCVRDLLSGGLSNAEISRRLGINASAVSNIKTGARYAGR